ncbi:MAG TPA: T9SS type A sorting domain-containing protein [Bacteroidia bacterium]|nr:T9SS type A sorting domain-containing protein [Bacteroidia bacterium]
MKKSLLLITTIFASITGLRSQNLFTNPDFELYSSCPLDQDEVYKCIDWFNIIHSSDYMNCNYTCWTGQTIIGAQSGTGYMGFASYDAPHATEAIAQELSSPLVAGNTYNIFLYAKKTTGPNYVNNCGGVCFYGWTGNPFLTGASGICPEDSGGVLLGCTDSVINTLWQPYDVTFTAPAAFDMIGMSVGCQFNNACGEYIFIDNLTMVISSVAENEMSLNGIKIFQDEGKGHLNVSFTMTKNSNMTFSLVNLLGETIFTEQKKIFSGTVKEQFQISNIAGGIYFLKIDADNIHVAKKALISR